MGRKRRHKLPAAPEDGAEAEHHERQDDQDEPTTRILFLGELVVLAAGSNFTAYDAKYPQLGASG